MGAETSALDDARLKGGPGRPTIKPSGMEKATEPSKPVGPQSPKRGPTKTKLTIHEEKTVKVAARPGSRFKGYTSFIVQDLILRSRVVDFRCERWLTPDRILLTAPLPDGIVGHFGAELRRFILAQYHQGQVTVPRLVDVAGVWHLHLQAASCPRRGQRQAAAKFHEARPARVCLRRRSAVGLPPRPPVAHRHEAMRV